MPLLLIVLCQCGGRHLTGSRRRCRDPTSVLHSDSAPDIARQLRSQLTAGRGADAGAGAGAGRTIYLCRYRHSFVPPLFSLTRFAVIFCEEKIIATTLRLIHRNTPNTHTHIHIQYVEAPIDLERYPGGH